MLLKLSPRLESLLIMTIAILLPMGASLAGSGTAGEPGMLSVEPAELDFGAVEIGETAVMTATVANAADPGAGALTLAALDLDGGGMLDPGTALVSLSPEGGQWNSGSTRAAVTPDGRYVAYISFVPANRPVAFRHDLLTGAVEVASANAEGHWVTAGEYDGALAISPDGRHVAFVYNGAGVPPVPGGPDGYYLRDMAAGTTEYIDLPTTDGEPPNGFFQRMSFSDDFRTMAFVSQATNLVPEGDEFPQWAQHVYVYDRDADTFELVSVASDGTPASAGGNWNPVISAGGRYVAFRSLDTNLVPDDTNGEWDIFVHDREAGITERVSVASDGSEGNAMVAPENDPAISADGRYIAFAGNASNLVPEDTNGRPDVFVRDLIAGTTERISVASDGSQAVGGSDSPAITPDGRYVVFHSDAPNLVPGDTNGQWDTFVHDRVTGATERVSVAANGAEGNGPSFLGRPGISADGRFVAFATNASLAPDINGEVDIYIRDRGGPAPATAFAVTGGDCAVGTVLEPGDGCTLEITFSPFDSGIFEEALVVESDGGAVTRLNLTGEGDTAGGAEVIFKDRFEQDGP